ncbi:MAG: MFS transporter, partial [Nitrospira sp. SB0666_bin_27]|nr:MFS transporter [Nitrospira sp. SB0666_bin_27]
MSVSPIFVLLCGVGFSSFVSYNLVRMPALAPFAESLGAGPLTVGFIVAASTMTGIFINIQFEKFSELVNRSRLMMVGVLAFALPPFVYPLVSNLEVLTVLRLVHGLATAVFTPLALAMVADLYPATRGAALGWYTSAAQGGALVGPMLGGWIIDTAGYTETFLTGGAFGLVGFALYLMLWWRCPAPSRHVKLEAKV